MQNAKFAFLILHFESSVDSDQGLLPLYGQGVNASIQRIGRKGAQFDDLMYPRERIY